MTSDYLSPRLVFGPDNDSDDYTQVIAYINSEFASIKAEEEGKRENVVGNVVENVVVNLPPKVSIFLDGYSRKKHAGSITCVFCYYNLILKSS